MGTFLQIVTRVGGIGAGAIAWPALALSAVMVMASIPSANAQQTTGTPGSPGATTTIDGRLSASATAEVRPRDEPQRPRVEALVAAARGPSQGRTEHPANLDRRRWLQRPEHFRGRYPDAVAGPHRCQRPALREFPHHVAVLAHARRADHRAQPPLGWL